MHFKLAAAITLGYFLSIASAATHNVSVGVDNKDNYEPELWVSIASVDVLCIPMCLFPRCLWQPLQCQFWRHYSLFIVSPIH